MQIKRKKRKRICKSLRLSGDRGLTGRANQALLCMDPDKVGPQPRCCLLAILWLLSNRRINCLQQRWSAKLKTLNIWPFTEKVRWSSVAIKGAAWLTRLSWSYWNISEDCVTPFTLSPSLSSNVLNVIGLLEYVSLLKKEDVQTCYTDFQTSWTVVFLTINY